MFLTVQDPNPSAQTMDDGRRKEEAPLSFTVHEVNEHLCPLLTCEITATVEKRREQPKQKSEKKSLSIAWYETI